MVPPSSRVPWVTSRVQGTPSPPPPFRVERVFGDHQFQQPVTLTSAPGTDHMYLLELEGKLFELSGDDQDHAEPTLITDLKTQVPGLRLSYGFDFHPRFQHNRQIFVCYSRDGEQEVGTVVSRFRLSPQRPLRIEPDSQQILYTWRTGGHNGGCVKFGPDGYLYVSSGDAADPFPPDPFKAGQDLTTLLSKIVRIDVDQSQHGLAYAIPADNPFVDLPGARPEIWSYGFRNPWRMAFDRETGDLWVGDVGWELWEMIHRVTAGSNHGWSLVEGPHGVYPQDPVGPTPVIKPVASHSHSEARSITGGQVYYGDRFPELQGAYVYGDHVTGRIWSLRRTSDGFSAPAEIARSPLQIICFGLHASGELYIVDYLGGIFRLARNERSSEPTDFPFLLSESGIFLSTEEHALSPGVLAYRVAAEPWMDGATADRFIGIPDQAQIGVYTVGDGHASWDGKHPGSWEFPDNTVLGKTISLQGRRVETQLLHFDGQAWLPYTYIWNEAQSDARLADDVSQLIEVPTGDPSRHWLISNRTECMVCHSSAADMVLGFKPDQLRVPRGQQVDQLQYFQEIGLFQSPPSRKSSLVDPYDTAQDLDARARSYLHVNCSHCHRRDGGGAVAMDVVFQRPLDRTHLIDETPSQGTFGLDGAKVIVKGDPFRSVLLYRMSKLGPGHMPKLGGVEVDDSGVLLLADWIASLGDHEDQVTDALRQQCTELIDVVSRGELAAWLSDPRRSLMMAHAHRQRMIPPILMHRVIEISAQLPATAKDLFESFLPLAERTERLGPNIREEMVLAEAGDADRGRQLFHSDALSCKSCHATEPGATSLGPNLSSLDPSQDLRDALLDSILYPSRVIRDQYRTHVIQSADGILLTGVVTSDGEMVVMRDAQNLEHRIASSEIEYRKQLEVSLMPEQLLATLTLQQARDLLEYLMTLKVNRHELGPIRMSQ